ncbi:carotenoid oxygenase [Cadophora sp. MPI-SDFR-AT-0126]|nr:carotenoid oxygenase [Leotiomycetes sp. MPI-SDFR-AT-0126]
MAGHFRSPPPQISQTFPPLPQFSGFMKPCRFEGEVQNLEVVGTIPTDIDGTFYRVMPDPQMPPFVENDPWFNGDGNISAFHIKSGKVHFKQRYVRTEKFLRERQAQRALVGKFNTYMSPPSKYRNKFTDAVEFKIRTTANTNIFYFNGVLLACKEDAPPYAMDPHTLETIGLWDFDGQLPSLTFSAHPKIDPVTKELISFGYEARGDGTPDICYYTVSPIGKFTETVWMTSPVVAMIHDFAVTKNYVIFPVIPQTCDIERMKAGGEHWQWNPDIPFYIGLLPRRGAKGSDIKWFQAPNAFPGHVSNAYETPDGNVILELALSNKNAFFWWPDANGNAPDPTQITSNLAQVTLDPRATDLKVTPRIVLKEDIEFCRVDDRFAMSKHQHVFCDLMDPRLTDFPAIGRVMGGGFPPYNSLGHFDSVTNKCETYFVGARHLVQEPVFVPRSEDAAEGDGYLLALVNNYDQMTSELHLVDTRDFSKPQAVVLLPVRLRHGLHGNWVDGQDLALVIN